MTSGSSSSASVSASSAMAPTGVFSSWLMLATRSVRTESRRTRSLASSMVLMAPTWRPPTLDHRAPHHERPAGRPVDLEGVHPLVPGQRVLEVRLDGLVDQRVEVGDAEEVLGLAVAGQQPALGVDEDDAGRQDVERGGQLLLRLLEGGHALPGGRELLALLLAGGGGAPAPPEVGRGRSDARPHDEGDERPAHRLSPRPRRPRSRVRRHAAPGSGPRRRARAASR